MTARPDQAIRLGLIGCGGIAYWAHLRSLRNLPQFQLILAADPLPAARQRAATLTEARMVADPAEILDHPEIDAVLIAAPSHLHARLATEAADAGKPFYLEKPLAASADDALPALQAIQSSGVTTRIGFNRRFHPVHVQARRLIQSGTLGRIHSVQTVFCEPLTGDALPAWKRSRTSGGGVLLDLASHHFDLLRWMLDARIESASADTRSTHSEQDSADVHLRLHGGITAQCHFSFLTGPADHLEFQGELGSIRVDRHRPSPILRLRRRSGYGLVRGSPGWSAAGFRQGLLHRLRPGHDPSYHAALAGFANALRGLPDPGADAADGWESLAAVLAAEGSVEAGQPIALPSR